MNNIDWHLIHCFLTAARFGSLSAAARELSISQPTLSRSIQAIESQTELNLFKRTPQGLELTEEGQKLVDAAQQMEQGADLFQRLASGLSVELTGDIRISANEIVGIYLLPPVITAFQALHPEIQIEIVITNKVSSLNKREADIALRMFRPTQPDLVARRLADMTLGFYAHREYLKQRGTPLTIEEFFHHNIIGFDDSQDFIQAAQEMGYEFNKHNFKFRTDHMLAQINLARAGAGIVVTHTGIAQQLPEFQQILQNVHLPPLEFWAVCHSDTQHSSRIRSFRDFLIDWFKEDAYRHVLL